ncbi:MAG: hypothetical protein AAGL34_00005, partial [Bacteroidota bacterium]
MKHAPNQSSYRPKGQNLLVFVFLLLVSLVQAQEVTLSKVNDGDEDGPTAGELSIDVAPTAPAGVVQVFYTITGGTATEGTDFSALSGSVVVGYDGVVG